MSRGLTPDYYQRPAPMTWRQKLGCLFYFALLAGMVAVLGYVVERLMR